MTRMANLSPANWNVLVEAGPAIAFAVASAAGSPRQSVHEIDAFLRFVSESTAAEDRTTFLGELVWELADRLAAGWPIVSGDAFMEGVEHARRAGAILGAVVDPADAVPVRDWYRAAAQRVAEAVREGGRLGVGGPPVSESETATLDTIADALGSNQRSPEDLS
jgi:hypothetical protein